MRTILILIFSLMAVPAMAANLQGIVFGYECKHIDPKETGFTCSMNKTGSTKMKIHFIKDFDKLPREKREFIEYKFSALILRYLDLGGVVFDITYEWQPKTIKECSRSKANKLSYYCETVNS